MYKITEWLCMISRSSYDIFFLSFLFFFLVTLRQEVPLSGNDVKEGNGVFAPTRTMTMIMRSSEEWHRLADKLVNRVVGIRCTKSGLQIAVANARIYYLSFLFSSFLHREFLKKTMKFWSALTWRWSGAQPQNESRALPLWLSYCSLLNSVWYIYIYFHTPPSFEHLRHLRLTSFFNASQWY